MSDKTKAELVVELVGDVNIARLEGDRETIYVGIVDYQTGGLDVDSNPNTAEAIENALRVLSGEVVEVKLKTVYVAFYPIEYEPCTDHGIFATKELALECLRKEYPKKSDEFLIEKCIYEEEVVGVESPSIPDAIQQILDRVELQQKESGSTELDNTAHHLWYAHKGSLPRMEFPEETFDELIERAGGIK